jgi:phage shock protein C
MATTERRLMKSRTDRMIDGVCGGVAAYFSIDPTLVRVAWVLLTLMGGSGIILYIVAMIIMPKEAAPVAAPQAPVDPAAGTPVTPPAAPPANHDGNTKFWGILLVCVGALWLLSNLGLSVCFDGWGFPWHVGIPLLFILAGVAFLFGGRSYVSAAPAADAASGASAPAGTATPAPAAPTPRLYRSRTDKKIMGVCGGLAAHLGVDPAIVRLMLVAGVLVSHGFLIILYFLMGIIVPKEPEPVVAA